MDPDAAYEPEALLAAVPATARLRGMFYDFIGDAYVDAGLPRPFDKLHAFSFEKRRPYLEYQLQAARDLYPSNALGRGLYQLGRRVYPSFAQTMIGKAIFALAGRRFERVVSAGPRAYAASLSEGELVCHTVKEGHVHVALLGIYDFTPFTCGVWQGAMDVCEVKPTRFDIKVAPNFDVEFLIEW